MRTTSTSTIKTIYTQIESPLGKLLLASREDKLSGLYFADQPHARIAPGWVRQDDADIFAQTAQQLAEYASGERQRFDLPLGASGTAFRALVWAATKAIPFGQTITYGELAQGIGRSPSKDTRAVGGALGANAISLIVPCHRVVGKDGSLTGYAGGIERKKALLEFEAGRLAGRDVVLELRDGHPSLVAV